MNSEYVEFWFASEDKQSGGWMRPQAQKIRNNRIIEPPKLEGPIKFIKSNSWLHKGLTKNQSL